MSMNLGCSAMRLQQLGTWHSQLVLSLNKRGKPDDGWKGVRRRYIFWCRH